MLLLLMVIFSSIFACQKSADKSLNADLSLMVPMSDGIKLETEIWLPEKTGRFPVILTRGYGTGSALDARRFTQAGYVYVGQSARGHAGSQGKMKRFFTDADDGYDTLDWIVKQPWSNGDIAMYGKSFWAATQWLLAVKQHPNLKAIIPQNINADLWQCSYRCNGALTLGMSATGRAYDHASKDKIRSFGWDRLFRHLPLKTLNEVAGAHVDRESVQLWQDYIEHDHFDEYWSSISIRGDGGDDKYKKIDIPVLLMGGWYDYYTGAAFNSLRLLNQLHPEQDHRIIIDETSHLNEIVGDRAYSLNAKKDEVAEAIRWLDYILHRTINSVGQEAPIKVFTTGENRWNSYHQWPPKNASPTRFYLSAGQTLTQFEPETSQEIGYRYNPELPVPSLGGNHSFIDEDAKSVLRPGPVDQSPLEARPDVLLFHTEPLQANTTISGPVTAKIFAATTAKDTDFIVRLLDIQPDGSRYNITEGIIRARFRKSVWQPPELLEPNKIYQYTIELQPISHQFKKGHQIAIHLTSSSFPLWDRNPNTGNKQGEDTRVEIAQQTIQLGKQYPSHIVLPIQTSP